MFLLENNCFISLPRRCNICITSYCFCINTRSSISKPPSIYTLSQSKVHPFNIRMYGYYEVYLARYTLTLKDPDTPGPRYHTAIFVKTTPDKSGILHHVRGDITSAHGMEYIPEPKEFPEDSHNFHSVEKLGVTPVSKHPEDWEKVLRGVKAPHQQKAFNRKTMKTEPFKTLIPLTFYEPGEPRNPLMKCTEWTLERAVPALRANGLIIPQ